MNPFDRRQLLISVPAIFAVNACRTLETKSATKADVSSQSLIVRKRWETGKEQDFKAKFIQAVSWLKANDEGTFAETDPRSYLSWKKLVLLHQKSCPHSNWLFLPWHRLYLLYFESACQIALEDPTFALPYWDWTLDPSIPKEFYETPVLQAKRDLAPGGIIPESYTGKEVMTGILANGDFMNFHSYPFDPLTMTNREGQFEGTPHNNVHNTIGGIMGNVSDSPLDPIFWLHHCNVDRLWAEWLQRHPDSLAPLLLAAENDKADPMTNPLGVAWANTVLALDQADNLPGFPPQKPAKAIPRSPLNRDANGTAPVKALLDTAYAGYAYDTVPSIPFVQNIRLDTAVARQTFETRTITGQSVITSSQVTTKLLLSDANRLRDEESIANLVLLNLPIPGDEIANDILIRFFLSTGDSSPVTSYFSDNAEKHSEFVGLYRFFKRGRMHKHHGDASRMTVSLGIKKALDKLVTKYPTQMTLVAVAWNLKERRSAQLFSEKGQTEIQIELRIPKT